MTRRVRYAGSAFGVFLGLVGLAADASNGSAFRLTPDPLRIALAPCDETSALPASDP